MYLIPIYQIYFNKTIHALKAVVVFSFINNPALVFSFIDVSFIVLKFIKHLNTKKKKNRRSGSGKDVLCANGLEVVTRNLYWLIH